MTVTRLVGVLLALFTLVLSGVAIAQDVPLKGLGRFSGWRENALIGYGLVVGLAGSGDSSRSQVTRQTLNNVYSRLGVTVSEDDINSRNVAVVVVVAKLPASANVGDSIPVTVSSAGDARSLAGGTLLMTPLLGPDQRPYALAQGPLLTGGDSFESQLNLNQRNYPTTARLEDGATIETEVDANLLGADNTVGFLLHTPSFTTAKRAASAINSMFGAEIAWAKGADEIRIRYDAGPEDLIGFLADLENVAIRPDQLPRIVINERTGTVVAGGDVTISSVVISQGDIKVEVTSDSYASQPSFISGFANDVRSLIVTNTQLDVSRGGNDVVASFPNTTIADLVRGLSAAKVDTRRIISILQAMRSAGAVHAEIIVQ
jgi:flagellar P-ring protein precursor FlgI